MPATVMKRGKKKGPPSSSSNGGSVGNCSESAMDDYLKSLDMYRKSIAKDGSCLFRAVSEQVYHCQSKHLQVRKECIEFMRKNREKFEEFIEGPFDHHLFKLQNPKEWAGQVEISALSLMYKKDFVVYQNINFEPTKVTDNGFSDKIMLCFSNGNHYDAVYTQRFRRSASLCQSIIYDLLYSNVFPLLGKKELGKAQQLVKKEDYVHTTDVLKNGDTSSSGQDNEQDEGEWTTVQSRYKAKFAKQNKSLPEHEEVKAEEMSKQQNSNLQWEINRSISVDCYRNVELEAWEEAKHDQQQKDWTVANTIQYRKNDRCLAQLPVPSASPDKIYTVIINDVNLDRQTAAVFVPELKERMVISLQNLKPQEVSSDSSYRELSGYYKKTESNGPVNEDGEKYRKKSDRRPRPRRNFSRGEDQGEDGNPRRGATQDDMPQRPGRPGSGRDRMNKRRFGGRSREDRRAQEDEEEKRFIAEQTKLIELQEKDPKAFPALPSVQDNKSPRPKNNTALQESQPVQPQEKVVPPPAPVPLPEAVVDQSPAVFWSNLKIPKQAPSPSAKDLSSTSLEQSKQNAIPSVVTGQQSSPLVEELETRKVNDSPVVSKTADQINKAPLENDLKPDLIDTEGRGDNSSKGSEGLHDTADGEKLIKAESKGTKFDAAREKIVSAPVIPNKADVEEITKRRISIEVKIKPEEVPKTISLPSGEKGYELESNKSQPTRMVEITKENKVSKTDTFMESPLALKQTVETGLTFHTEPPKTIEELVKSNPPKRFEKAAASKERLPNKKAESPQNDLTKLNNSPKNENGERTEGLTPKSIIMTNNGNTSSKLEKKTVTFQVPPETTERINSFESDKQEEVELSSPVSGQKPVVSGQGVSLNAGAPRQPYTQFVKREPGILPVSSLPSPLGTENKGFVENTIDKPNLAPSDSSHVPETVSITAPIPNNLETSQNLIQSSSPVEMDDSPSPEESTTTAMSSSPQVAGTQSQAIGYMQYGPMLTVQLDAIELPTDINTLKYFYSLGVQYYNNSMLQGMHANPQAMMVYPVYQDHLPPQAQTPVSLSQQHFPGSQQSVFYSHQPPMQQYTPQPVHIPPVSQEGASYPERNNAERPMAAVQQTSHSLPMHQQVPFHAPVMSQNWRQQRPQQTFGNANFGHQNKSMHGYQHQNTSFQNNRQTHQGSQYSKPRDSNSGHKKHPKKQHYRNDIHSQNPYTANSSGGQQIHAQSASATMTGAQPFPANVAAATGNPVVASSNYFVGGDHLQGNKSPGEYYGQGNQPYRQYQHGMAQAPHSGPSLRSPYSQ